MKHRCPWCKDDPTYVAYHDEVCGLPVHDDKKLCNCSDGYPA